MDIKINVDAGVCGFQTAAKVTSPDGQNVGFEIQSGCEKIQGLAKALQAQGLLDAYEEINPAGSSVLWTTVHERLKGCCSGCVVPVGLFKGMQVAAGLALPKDVSVRIASA